MAKSIKGITRIEYDGVTTRGWMVRLTRGGERQQEFFNDRTHGGKNKALAAAKQRYEEWVAAAPPIQTSKNLKSSRNTSGKVGVHMVRNVDPRWANAESFGYCAMWTDSDGVRRKVSFAWNTYGKRKAWNLACLARDLESTDREAVIAQFGKDSKKGKGTAGPKTTAGTKAVKAVAAKPATKKGATVSKPLKGTKSAKATGATKAAKAVKGTNAAKPVKASKAVKAAKAIKPKAVKAKAVATKAKATKSAKPVAKATKAKRK